MPFYIRYAMPSRLKCILITLLFFGAAPLVSAQVEFTPIKKQFDASAVSDLVVDAPNANLTIHTSNRSDVDVQVVVSGRNQERVENYYANQHLSLTLEERTLQLYSDPNWQELDGRNWRNPPTIEVIIAMPATVYPELYTSTGAVRINELKAGAKIKTIHGDISVDSISGGPIKLQSSDGSITAKELQTSFVTAKTIHGNIAVDLLYSEHAEFQTSSGEITANKMHGTSLSVRTIHSDIEMEELIFKEELLLQSSGGDIAAEQIDARSLITETIHGNVEFGIASIDHAEIQTSNGTIKAGRIQGTSVLTKSIQGDIKVTEVTSSSILTLQSSGGSITAHQIAAPTLTVKTVHGALDLGFVSSDHAEIQTSRGAIHAERIQGGSVLIKSILGSINAGQVTASETITLQSSDGNITAEQIDASTLIAKTIRGRLNIGSVSARYGIDLRSSEGTITVTDLEGGSVFVRSIQGSILVENVTSRGEISLQTSRGNIIAEHLKGAFVTAKATSKGDLDAGIVAAHADMHVRNGDIQIRQIVGSLVLHSSNGDTQIGVMETQNIRITASNGDVTLSAPEKFAATLDLAGKKLDISGWGLTNPDSEPRLKMATQKGAPLIHVRAINGEIILAPLQSYNISSASAVPPPVP